MKVKLCQLMKWKEAAPASVHAYFAVMGRLLGRVQKISIVLHMMLTVNVIGQGKQSCISLQKRLLRWAIADSRRVHPEVRCSICRPFS